MQTSRRTCSSFSPTWSSARSRWPIEPGSCMPVSTSTIPSPAASAHALQCGTPGHGSGRRRRQTPGSTRSPRPTSRRRFASATQMKLAFGPWRTTTTLASAAERGARVLHARSAATATPAHLVRATTPRSRSSGPGGRGQGRGRRVLRRAQRRVPRPADGGPRRPRRGRQGRGALADDRHVRRARRSSTASTRPARRIDAPRRRRHHGARREDRPQRRLHGQHDDRAASSG